MSDFNRFHRPGFYQEEDQLSEDKELTVGDLDLDDDDDENKSGEPNEEIPGYLEGRMSEEDRNKFTETENMDPNDVELGSFGSDTSDVQNDYDPKDVETLMKLMASEADALGEYLEAAKETNTDVLRRLYADIGDEERFHMEQLLFAKSELTGEKYVPKDPDVKKEYEELLAMGMDEETAMQTAVDKCHIRVAIDRDDDGKSFEETAEELEGDIKNLQETFELIQVTSKIILESYENHKLDPYVVPIMETAFYQEAYGSADKNWDPTTSINPFKLLGQLIGKVITFILNTVAKFRQLFNKTKNRVDNARNFVKEHGYAAIFQQGVHLYFEPQLAGNRYRLDPVTWKWYLCTATLHNACIDALKNIPGLAVNPYAIQWSQQFQQYRQDANVLMCAKNIPNGIQILDKIDLMKTKIPIPSNEVEKQALFECLTGYTGADKTNSGQSDNFINQIYMLADIWKRMMVAMQNNINSISAQKDSSGSAYSKNASKYDIAYKGIKACVDTCNKFGKCCISDIKEIANICKTVYSNMRSQDQGDIEANKPSTAHPIINKTTGQPVVDKDGNKLYHGAGDVNRVWDSIYGETRNAKPTRNK